MSDPAKLCGKLIYSFPKSGVKIHCARPDGHGGACSHPPITDKRLEELGVTRHDLHHARYGDQECEVCKTISKD